MTTPTTTAQTLPASWTPTAPGCLRSTDFWVWMYNTDLASSDARTVLGGPSQTTDCLAPTWTSDAAYAGTQCPPNYTPACSADAVTCCPTVYDFTCVANVQPTAHQEMFRCVSQWGSGRGTATMTLTNFQENKIGQVTRELSSHQHLVAMAMVFTTPTSTATSSSSTSGIDPATATPPPASSTSTPPSTPSNSSLSTAAAAGIGVGATAGFLLISILWQDDDDTDAITVFSPLRAERAPR
ncbi:hypothetical protein SLS62_001957 [Diatrype stigma]|uniref:Uncharacterized protein n=1 Tax=Diatrype stigma TaxID=117547 RepID=A0AAN9V7K1_9PEZI